MVCTIVCSVTLILYCSHASTNVPNIYVLNMVDTANDKE